MSGAITFLSWMSTILFIYLPIILFYDLRKNKKVPSGKFLTVLMLSYMVPIFNLYLMGAYLNLAMTTVPALFAFLAIKEAHKYEK